MKKAILYTLCLLSLMTALAGCGATNDATGDPTYPTVTTLPAGTTPGTAPAIKSPDTAVSPMPDVNDGIVNDTDGVIEERDNGPLQTSPAPTARAKSAKQ